MQQPSEKPLKMNCIFQSSNRDTLSQDTISLGEYMLVHTLLFSDVYDIIVVASSTGALLHCIALLSKDQAGKMEIGTGKR